MVIWMCCNIDIFKVDNNFGDVNLNVPARFEFKIFTLGKTYNEFLNEGSHIVVRNDLTFPFLDSEHFFGNLDLHILFYFHLTSKSEVVRDLFT